MDAPPLSNVEIENKLKKYGININFVPYHILKYLKTIDTVLPALLLYEHHFPIGHWSCVFRNDEGYNYFDPTGRFPDQLNEENFDHFAGREKMGTDFTYLTDLLHRTNQKLVWNDFPLQIPDSNTCGHWNFARLLYSHLTNDEFNDIFKDIDGVERQRKIVALYNQF